MKVRSINNKNIVWFGSYGIDSTSENYMKFNLTSSLGVLEKKFSNEEWVLRSKTFDNYSLYKLGGIDFGITLMRSYVNINGVMIKALIIKFDSEFYEKSEILQSLFDKSYATSKGIVIDESLLNINDSTKTIRGVNIPADKENNIKHPFSFDIKLYSKSLLDDNYREDNQLAVRDALIQKLSVVKGELWYKSNYGVSYFDKMRSKSLIDSQVLDIITNQTGVSKVNSFTSTIDENSKTYTFSFTVTTIYNTKIEVSI